MKTSLLVLLAAAAVLRAETPPDFAWAVQAGGPKHDKTRALAVGRDGSVFMAGEFSATAKFGDFTVESKGDLDFFVAKYSPEGRCVWVRTGGGSKIDRGYGVAVDAQGDVFVTGHYQSTDATFGAATLPNRGDYDIFVGKYSAAGELLWMKTGGGAGYDYGHRVALDSTGNAYVTGALVGDYEFVGTPGTNQKGGHAFLARFSTAGDLTWLRVSTGTGGNAGEHVAVSNDGRVVIAGGTSGTTSFGDLTLANPGGRDAFAACFDTSGKPLWTFKGDGSASAMFSTAEFDSHGGVSVCGMWKGTLKLGGQTIESAGDNDILAAKLDRDGKLRWLRTGGSAQTDYALCLATDADGATYVTGEISDGAALFGEPPRKTNGRDLYVAKFDDVGTLRWLRSGGGVKGDLSYCIALDARGGIYVSGAFDGTGAYGKTTVTSAGSNDILLLKLSGK